MTFYDPFTIRRPIDLDLEPPIDRLKSVSVSDDKIAELVGRWNNLPPAQRATVFKEVSNLSDAELKRRFAPVPKKRGRPPKKAS